MTGSSHVAINGLSSMGIRMTASHLTIALYAQNTSLILNRRLCQVIVG